MRSSFFPLLALVAFIASTVDFTTGESAIQTQVHLSPSFPQNGKTVRYLKSTADKEDDSIPSDEEDRASVASLVDKVKSLLRLNPTKMQAAKNNPKGANEAISKVNSIIGPGKTSTELTPEKAKALETYARNNPNKWYAMAYYINYVFGIGLVAFLLYGTFYLGWRPLGMGGPRVN